MRFASVSLLVSATSATLAFDGCPNVSVENFDAASFVGKWYEVQRETFIPFEVGANCHTQEYRLTDDGRLDYNWRVWTPMMFFNYASVKGQLYNFNNGESTCTANMDFSDTPSYTGEDKYPSFAWDVLDVDYENWFVMYNCMEMIENGFRAELVHIFSRNPTISADELAEAHASIKAKLPNYDLSWITVSDTDQSTCEYEWKW